MGDTESAVWVDIDPNVRTGRGLTFTGIEDVHGGPIEEGQVVNVREPESGLHGGGLVTSIDHERGLVYLSIAWDTLRLPADIGAFAEWMLMTEKLFDGYRLRQEHARREATRKAQEREQVAAAQKAIELAPDLLRPVLELHQPVETYGALRCEGCDQGCNCDDARWPCSTWRVLVAQAVDLPGLDDPDSRSCTLRPRR